LHPCQTRVAPEYEVRVRVFLKGPSLIKYSMVLRYGNYFRFLC